MANSAVKLKTSSTPSSKKSTSLDTTEIIKSRRSQELVIALCGAVGSGIKNLQKNLLDQLDKNDYHVEHIRLSDLIADYSSENESEKERIKNLVGFARYKELQDLGDSLRNQYGNGIVSEFAIGRIALLRESNFGSDLNTPPRALKVTKKVAYIIDQVKHPDEIELLREVYRNNFYLIGLLRTENERRKNLKENDRMTETEIVSLIERDRKATEKYGQQVEESLHKSDYFIRNIDVAEKISKSVDRFIKLVHGTNHITPTKDETGIYAAYSASLRSACLSRQVGAAITDDIGVVISTGCNDVPKFGGGLYDSETSRDNRCFNLDQGLCHNDKHKSILRSEIESILNVYNIVNSKDIADKILKNSKAKSLIEYSRAIHAEMDAIIALARSSNNTLGRTLYCTTYPCHICARHIVASGIKRVVYIEPYEKSLAIELHSDAIYQPENRTQEEKVLFENFEGVSPKRYAKFFGISKVRKDNNGRAMPYAIKDSGHVDPQYLDSYFDYELKIIGILREKFPES
ncbi:anti-phage dCTP deaminase [Methylovulum psychrotolerans]|uniref:Cytidine deaminase n=1 Tax=Methylovulum psychrotolerans TaxID=1704499 RepID=A0A2S5CKD3_9GAMM|nr:anti-phage dCTP deaminase [Methylovulum psychrotolerans]MBT9097042.1 hypothetical protein [Methylovulum psychrotolerans]POZ51227.1 cytidine deaminase [Methylovulum psychrotolerans]